MSVVEFPTRPQGESRLLLEVALPRLARHAERALRWLEAFDAASGVEQLADLSRIPGAEGMAALAALPKAQRKAELEQAEVSSREQGQLQRIADRLGLPEDPMSPAAALVRAFPQAGSNASAGGRSPQTDLVNDDREESVGRLEGLAFAELAASVEAWADEKSASLALRVLADLTLRQGSPLPPEFWEAAAVKAVASEDAVSTFMVASVCAVQGRLDRALTLYRQANALCARSGDVQGQAATLLGMARIHAQQGRVEEAFAGCREAQRLYEQVGDVQGKAATLHGMASVHTDQGRVGEALELYTEALDLTEQIRDLQGKAVMLHSIARIHADQGRAGEALELFEESLALTEQIGDLKGKATTLQAMARIHADQGQVEEAFAGCRKAQRLCEQAGDVQGQAVTLANMAWLAGQQGDAIHQASLNREAAAVLAEARVWSDLFAVLIDLGATEEPDAEGYDAQALWLGLRASAASDRAVEAAVRLAVKAGLGHAMSPRLAGYAAMLQALAGEHAGTGEMAEIGLRVLAGTAQARGIVPEDFGAWLEREGLVEAHQLLPALSADLEALVPEGEWLFDRALVPELDVDRWLAENQAIGEPVSQ